MDYSQLPVEERIEKAAEYCLLLEEDDLPRADKLDQLSSIFMLTRQQAEKAYLLMREKYKTEYKSSTSRKLTNTWVFLFVSGVAVLAYTFIAQELGVVFYILAAFFAFSAIALMGNLVGTYIEKTVSPKKFLLLKRYSGGLTDPETMPDRLKSAYLIPFSFLTFSIIMLFIYLTHPKYVDESSLKSAENLTLISEPYKESSGGRHPSYYYVFHFAGYPHDFRIKDDYYNYGEWKFNPADFSYRGRITIQLKTKQAERMEYRNEKRKISIVNIFYKERWLVNHDSRNRKIHEKDRNNLLIFASGFVLSCVGAWLWLRFKKSTQS